MDATVAMYASAHADQPYHDGSPDRFTEPLLHWAKERSEAYPFHFNDGASITLTTSEPEGADYRWMGVGNDSVPQEADGDQD